MRIHQLIVGTTLFLAAVNAVLAGELKAKTAVLVHGAFADGSSWQKVIPILEKAGLKVVAVQNPLDSLENDVAATKRAIRDAEGPVVLVGHSWGGVVITEAGSDEKVKSLVYVSSLRSRRRSVTGKCISKISCAGKFESFHERRRRLPQDQRRRHKEIFCRRPQT